ncbi:lytic polysaccharide monooxygenase, partial [Lentithecium fluviatile CBS 122367]
DLLTPDHRCGRDAWKPSPWTGIVDVIAGDTVGFGIETTWDSVTHIGPGLAYLAKKPVGVELSQWDGDGDWVKIDYKGPITKKTTTVSMTTPPGQYLLRVEQIYPSLGNESQFYVNCAQINIIGPGGGTPTDFARFPGTYKVDEAALSLPVGEEHVVGNDVRWEHGFLPYVPPGPPVWTG